MSIILSALIACSLSGCNFDERSGTFACATQMDCSDGRVCEMGWCVVSESQVPDADLPLDAAMPDNRCVACESGACSDHCAGAQCAYECAVDGCQCSFSCTEASMTCNGTCNSETICNIDCGKGRQCHATCKSGSICDVDCTGVKDCKRVSCEGNAQCILNCTDTAGMNCMFERCDGVELSCANDIKVCNRDCP